MPAGLAVPFPCGHFCQFCTVAFPPNTDYNDGASLMQGMIMTFGNLSVFGSFDANRNLKALKGPAALCAALH